MDKYRMDVAGSALMDLAGIENSLPGIMEGIREKIQKIESLIDRA